MVIVNEPYEVIKIRNGKEIARSTRTEEVGYCDDCGKEINPDFRSYNDETRCSCCGKQICEDHRYPFPTAELQEKRSWMCDRCRTTFAKEIGEYALYIKTLSELESAVETFKREYGAKKLKGYSPLYFREYIQTHLAKEIREKQARSNKDKARRMQKKMLNN